MKKKYRGRKTKRRISSCVLVWLNNMRSLDESSLTQISINVKFFGQTPCQINNGDRNFGLRDGRPKIFFAEQKNRLNIQNQNNVTR